MRDPYAVLGVPRDADAAAIKAAYRGLAKTWHPDRHPGDAEAERRFKEISAAYNLLADPGRRRRFDSGEINADGQERGFRGFRPGRGFEGVFDRAFGGGRGFSGGSIDDILGDLFGGRGGARARGGGGARRGAGAQQQPPGGGGGGAAAGARRHRLEVDFLTAVRGGRQRLTLPDGRAIEVDVPPGTEEGQVLRLKGRARPAAGSGGSGAAGAGDAAGAGGDGGGGGADVLLVEVAVRPHPRLTRKGRDIHLELPVSLPEAVLGAKVTVPTVDGPVRVAVPAGSNSGATLRLRGRGVPSSPPARDGAVTGGAGGGERGDQYVRLVVMLPERPDPELTDFLRRWSESHGYEVRAEPDTA